MNHEFEDIFRRFILEDYQQLSAYIRRIRPRTSPEDVADILQEALVAAWRKLEHLRSIDGMSAWVWTIIRNKLMEHYRTQGRRPNVGSIEEEIPDSVREDSSRRAVRAEEVRRAVSELPADPQRVIELRLSGWTISKIAAHLGCSEGTVKNRQKAAWGLLRETLGTDD